MEEERLHHLPFQYFFIVEKAAAVNDDTQLDILKAIEKKSVEQSFKPC